MPLGATQQMVAECCLLKGGYAPQETEKRQRRRKRNMIKILKIGKTRPFGLAARCLTCLAAGLLSVFPAQVCGQPVRFQRFVMPSGLRVIVHSDDRAPVVSVALAYGSGLNDEPSNLEGINATVAGMLSQASSHLVPGQRDALSATYGGRGSVEIGYDATVFCDNFSSNMLKGAIWLASERAYGFRDDTAAFARVRDDYRREDSLRARRVQELEEGALHEMVRTVNLRLVPQVAALDSSVSLGAAKAYRDLYFHPANAVLAVSGDVHPDTVRRYVVEMFSLLPPDTARTELTARRFSVADAAADTVEIAAGKAVDVGSGILATVEQKRHFDTLVVPQGPRSVIFAWQVLPYSDHQADVFDFIGTVLASPSGSRLYRMLVEEREQAYGVDYRILPMERASVFAVRVDLRPEAQVRHVEDALREQLEQLKNFEMTSGELAKALNTARMAAWESVASNEGMARTLALNELLFGDASEFAVRMERLSGITAQDVRTVARRFLRSDNMKTIYRIPASQGGAER